MEALIFFVFFALYILVRVLLGGGKTDWEKQSEIHREGIHLLRSGDLNSSIQYFRNSLQYRPFDALSYVMMGNIALKKKEPERALHLGSKALRLDNSIWQAHILMSKAFFEVEDYENALQNARNAVWFGRDSSEACHWYGKLLLETGEVEKGLDMMATSCRLGEEKAALVLRKRGQSQKRN